MCVHGFMALFIPLECKKYLFTSTPREESFYSLSPENRETPPLRPKQAKQENVFQRKGQISIMISIRVKPIKTHYK